MVTVLQRSTTRIVAMLVLAALGFALYGSASRAEAVSESAQAATVISDIYVDAVNGHADLGPGTGYGGGLIGISCTGNWPRGGPKIPAGVVTEPLWDRTYLRILAPVQAGQAQKGVTGGLYVNCVVEGSSPLVERFEELAASK